MTADTAVQPSLKAFVRKQTIISAIISIAFSAGFFVLIFGSLSPIAVWAPDYLAFDLLHQSGAASLMAALMPALQTRTAIARGDIPGQVQATRTIISRAILHALIGLGLAGMVIALLKVSGVQAFAWSTAFAIKVGFGGLLALIITPPAVRTALMKG